MATYAQLASEPEWGAQFIPPVMSAGLIGPLRVHYNLSFNAVGSAGDNNHLYGRHRSYAWDRASRYCTDRAYGTTDVLDQGGDRNWYRAVDTGIQGQDLFDASHRLDALARSGACPGLAEWFGTFDGINVVGWFEGQPSTADSSHTSHLHVGVYNSFADDAATMQQLFNAIVGNFTPSPTLEPDMAAIMVQDQSGIAILWTGGAGLIWQNVVSVDMVAAWNAAGVPGPFGVNAIGNYGQEAGAYQNSYYTHLQTIADTIDSGTGGGDGPTAQEIAEAVVDEEHARLEN